MFVDSSQFVFFPFCLLDLISLSFWFQSELKFSIFSLCALCDEFEIIIIIFFYLEICLADDSLYNLLSPYFLVISPDITKKSYAITSYCEMSSDIVLLSRSPYQ